MNKWEGGDGCGEQNPDLFRMYAVRLKLKDQIVMFNCLLEQQVCGPVGGGNVSKCGEMWEGEC